METDQKLSDHVRAALSVLDSARDQLADERIPVHREAIVMELTQAEMSLRRALHLIGGE
jgi:hypothetical protein